MACDKLVRGVMVMVLAPTLGKLVLMVPFEYRETPDVVEITFATSVSSGRRLASGPSRKACKLLLYAHVSRSVVQCGLLLPL